MNLVTSTVTLGLGELHATSDSEAILSCLGLGSCVALCLYDPATKVGGMGHMVLPASVEGRSVPKFVDVAVPMLLSEVVKLGAQRGRLVAKLVGGAQMMSVVNDTLNIGQRNADAAKEALRQFQVRLAAADLGGHQGRTVRLFLDSGRVSVTLVGGSSYEI